MAGQNKTDVGALLSSTASAVGSLLQNPTVEEANTDSDRVAASTTTNAGNLVQSSVAPTMPFAPDFRNKDDFLSMSYSPETAPTNPTKMVLLGRASWSQSQARTTEVFRISLPNSFWAQNTQPAYGQSRYFAAVRCGFHLQVQLNVNMGSAGALIVVYMSRTVFVNWESYSFGTFTNSPHIIMKAATTSQADLYIPYVNHHNFARVDTDDLGYVLGYVWSALTIPTGSPTSLDVTIFGSLLDLEFQNPRPFDSSAVQIVLEGPNRKRKTKASKFKWTREKIDIAEGPGAMNVANGLSPSGSQSTALVGERAFYDPRTAGAKARVKDLMDFARMPSVLRGDGTSATYRSGYFSWAASTTPGNHVFNYGIWWEDLPNQYLLSSCYTYWRGSIVLKLTIYASTFNKGRLRMALYPNYRASGSDTGYTDAEANNAIYVVCDIGLNNTFELTMPFTWGNWMRPTRGIPVAWCVIDVLNRLTYNSSSPNSVNCILQVRMGDDARLMVPCSSPYAWQSDGLRSWGSEMDLVDSLDNPTELMDAEETESHNVEAAQGEAAATAVGLKATENDGTLSEQLQSNQPMFLNFVKQNVSLFSTSHTKVDHIFGRAWNVTNYAYTTGDMHSIFVGFPTTQHGSLARLFAYFSGEVNFHITHTSSTGNFLTVTHTYYGTDSGIPRVSEDGLLSSGAMIIPPNEQMTLCVPFYSEVPLRCVKPTGGAGAEHISGLGTLFLKPTGSTDANGFVQIFVSLRCPNFFFPVPAPKQATSRSTIRDMDYITDVCQLEAIGKSKDLDDPLEVGTKPKDPLAELKQRAFDWFDARTGFKTPLMNPCGDVEENPGPTMIVRVDQDTEILITSLNGRLSFKKRVKGSDFCWPLSPNQLEDMHWIHLAQIQIEKRYGYRFWLLMLCGDVELNPGPDIELVYKNRGFYKHYGVRVGNYIYHLNSHDILSTAISGKATFLKEEDDGNWIHSMTAPLDYFTEKYMTSLVGSHHIFSASQNCETFARDIFPNVPGISQAKALGIVGVILLSAGLLSLLAVPFDYSSLCYVYNQSIDQDVGGLTLLSQRCMTFFSNTLMETFNNDLVKFIIKVLVRLLCYIVLYCHAPNMLTTMCLGTLLVMDITACEVLSSSSRALFQALVDGDIKKLVTQIAENLQFAQSTQEQAEEMVETVRFSSDLLNVSMGGAYDQSMADQGFKKFNEVSTSFRHVEWWLTMFKKLFNVLRSIFMPNEQQKAVKWIEMNAEKIASLLDEASDVLVLLKEVKNQRDQSVIKRYSDVLESMKPLVSLFVRVAPSTRFASTVFRIYSELLKVNVRMPVNKNMTRLEPIGIWISSEPGQGKSFLTHALATKILQKTKLNGIFTNPTGSEYMDGYCGQAVHIIDDAGQNREEKDLALLCQCISSVPFTVPMADLSEKGMFYESQFVIATTNKSDFVTTVLTDVEALKRRFPYKIKIRAKTVYSKDGRLYVPKAMSQMADGTCWEVSADGRTWVDLDLNGFVDMIIKDYEERVDSLDKWKRKLGLHNQSPLDDISDTIASLERRFGQMSATLSDYINRTSDELMEAVEDLFSPGETPFLCFEKQQPLFAPRTTKEKVVDWVKKTSPALEDFCERNKGWILFLSLLSSFLGILILVYQHYKNSQPDSKEQRAYNPQTSQKKGGKHAKFAIKTTDFRNEAPYVAELEHCFSQAAYISASSSSHVTHCAAMKENQLLVHGHGAFFLEQEEDLKLHFKGATFEIDSGQVSQVTLNGQKMDLMIVKLDKFPICFKNYTKYYTNKIGTDSLLIWNSPQGKLAMPVTNVQMSGPITTQEGTQTYKTYSYKVSSKRGMCGGLLVTRIEGAYKILGVHIAGNGMIGMAAAVGFIQNAPEYHDQGVVVKRESLPLPVFQPSKTKISPSPLNGIFPIKMEPAVLSPFDSRLIEPMSSVVKTAALKYRVNVFNVDQQLFLKVVDYWKQKFRQTFGLTQRVSIQQAIQGAGKLASLEISTSAGYKYASRGIKKKDLISLEPFWISDELVEDVKAILGDIYAGRVPKVVYTAYLKDELRKIEKVMTGKTRCIEAGSVDLIAYRVIMSELYEKIYQTPPQVLGLGVGMNPWVDWDSMMEALLPYNYGLDYASYDGSLYDELMRSDVEVMAYCHVDPEQVMILHETVINSEQAVMDEIWSVHGGMPSGAPCTTVLNSICNLLVCTYLAWEQDPTIQVLPIVYGDDVIYSVDQPLDMERFVSQAKNCFGMDVTNTDKTPIPTLVDFDEIEFLKRRTKIFPKTTFRVGALNLDTLEQHIMWMKNLDTFPEQIVSFENELSLHGRDVYDFYKEKFKDDLAKWSIFMNDYDVVIRRMVGYVFE
ncbi:polyprotein [parechovirus E1]|uniref:Genome polyprotein n=1 Tax=parechovirus E1 TaxID=2870367 RepID=A0A248AAI2_9PICO|nr:polyprotein [Falcon picornavirus]AQW45177.1 polyprotein [parechovirus E1]